MIFNYIPEGDVVIRLTYSHLLGPKPETLWGTLYLPTVLILLLKCFSDNLAVAVRRARWRTSNVLLSERARAFDNIF
jgi:hypothetical protein